MRNPFAFSMGLLIIPASICAQDFSDTPIVLTEMSSIYGQVEWVDLDGDKDLDAMLPNWVENVRLFRNDNGTLTEAGSVLQGEPFNYDNYTIVDFDADGDIDILLSNQNTIDVWLNQGNFTFNKQQTGIDLTSTISSGLKCLDVDADADLDLLAGRKIFLNTNGAFAESIVPFPPDVQNYVWGDINNDMIPDFIEIGYLELIPHIGRGNAVFEIGTPFAHIRNDGTFFLVDADGDGDLDIYVSEASYTYSIFKNFFKETGQVKFERGYNFPVSVSKVSFGDTNRDGLVDFLFYGYLYPSVGTMVFQNSSTISKMSFVQSGPQIPEEVSTDLSLIDFDMDGDLDIHLSASEFSSAYGDHKIYLNEQTAPVVASPQAPANPETIIGEEIELRWNPSSNVLYSIEVDRNGVGSLPSFSLDDGTLMRYSLATTLVTSGYKLKDLPAGEYRWRVQAIDYAYRASAFTAYQYFTIGDAPHSLQLAHPDFTHVILSWSYDGVQPAAYTIYRRSSKAPWEKIGEVSGTETSFADQTIVFDEIYEYAVRAVVGSVYSALSTPVRYFSGQFEEKSFARKDPNIVRANGGVGDIDGDGDYDLHFSGNIYADDEVTMKNDGLGNFEPAVVLPPTDANNSYGSLRYFGDLDSDGDLDVCFIASSGFGIRYVVYTNTDGTFAKSYLSPVFDEPLDYEFRDFNNDGLIDIFLASKLVNNSVYQYIFLYQTRSGIFDMHELDMGSEQPYRTFQSVDINNDGFLDIFFAGSQYPLDKALLAVNLNGRAFEVKETAMFPHAGMHFQDLNADGLLDVMYQHSDLRLVIHLGSGNEQFGEPIFIKGPQVYNQMTVKSADLDFNGWPELIVHDGYAAGIMTNNGDLNLKVAPYGITGKWDMQTLLTDFENDGDVDIVSTGNDSQHQGMSTVLTNHWKSDLRTNTPPTAPTGVVSTVGDGFVKVQWARSSDNTTPSNLITYNAWIVDGTGKSWIHPGTNAAGTFRNVLADGNAGARNFFFVNDLPAGNYTVKVQAVDASFALSPWSAPNTFLIEEGPSDLTVERILLNKVRLTWTNGPADETGVFVERKTPSSDFEVVAELGAGAVEFTDADLPYNEIFTYRVREMMGDVPTAHSNTVVWNTAMWEIKNTSLPNGDRAMEIGDFNADGKMDILMTGNYQEESNSKWVKAVFQRSGNDWLRQDFGDPIRPFQPIIFFEDFDRDGFLDIYEHGYNDGYKTLLYKNNGNGTLSNYSNALSSENLEVVNFLDYDMDNDLDAYVISRSATTATAKLVRNTGTDYADTPGMISLCSNCPAGITSADMDRDGDEDMIRFDGPSNYEGSFRLFLNTPEGFKSTSVTFPGSAQGVFTTVDYNGDGWTDVLFLSTDNIYGSNPSRLYRNLGLNTTGSLSFELLKTTLPAGRSSYVALNTGDFDHDGDLDLILTDPQITFLQNNNDNTFVSHTMPRFTASSGKSATIDYDDDGDLDILFTGYMIENYNSNYSPVAKVLENKLIDGGKGTVNQAPQPPSGLRSFQDVSGVHLEWDAPEDDHTPASAIRYDVILYDNGKPVYKNFVVPSTGERRKLSAGRSTASAILNNIPVGTYEWKVQAVDQNFAGSVFSELKTFEMLPPPPGIKDTTVYRCGRTIMLTARGENIRWYSDATKTNLLASGTYSPTESQKVFVAQMIGGVLGIAREIDITIVDRPDKPTILSGLEEVICESGGLGAVYMNAEGQDIEWYKDAALQQKVGAGLYYEASAQAAKYYVTQTIDGCQSLPSEVSVNVIEIDSKIVYEAGQIMTLEDDADSYQWYKNGFYISGANTQSIVYDGTPAVYGIVIIKDGCYEFSDPFLLTGIAEAGVNKFEIFPNPASHLVVVGNIHGDQVSVFNTEGKQVYGSAVPDGELRLKVSDWKRGAYFVVIHDGGKLYVRKFLLR